jgi:hypothetical protein
VRGGICPDKTGHATGWDRAGSARPRLLMDVRVTPQALIYRDFAGQFY